VEAETWRENAKQEVQENIYENETRLVKIVRDRQHNHVFIYFYFILFFVMIVVKLFLKWQNLVIKLVIILNYNFIQYLFYWR